MVIADKLVIGVVRISFHSPNLGEVKAGKAIGCLHLLIRQCRSIFIFAVTAGIKIVAVGDSCIVTIKSNHFNSNKSIC